MGQPLGQHFLYDEDILDQIIESADITKDDNVLEVGPGKGDLTKKLALKAKTVTSVELDPDLFRKLQSNLKIDNVSFVEKSILDFDLSQLEHGYSVVANIPYYLTSKLIKRFLEAENKPRRLVLLVQKEVAQRLAAKPGKMSILAISAQLYGDVGLGVEVPAELFDPPPKVDSQVVIIDVHKQMILNIEEKRFFRLVKAGFGEKRKKLSNSLAGGLGANSSDIAKILSDLNMSSNVRAQQLGMKDWQTLYDTMISKGLI